jgi:hypothetical protein
MSFPSSLERLTFLPQFCLISKKTGHKEYLQVWDLRQQGQTADEIAPSLWPDENATKGGRTHYGERGALIQRVYDYEKAANELVKNSFRSKRRAPKIKK